nr:transposase [uncultured Sellimonas sp.]
MEIDIPRDRKGKFEPQIVKKYQNTVTQYNGHRKDLGQIHSQLEIFFFEERLSRL